MKIQFVFAFVISVSAIRPCIAQKIEILSQPYQSSLNRASVKAYLDEINSKTGLVIEYSSNNLQLDNLVETNGKENSIGGILQKALAGQKIKLVEKNHKLILAPSSTLFNPDDLVPSYTVFGFIKEGEGKEPLIEATISEAGNQKMIITNAHGYYSLSLPEGDHHLQITYAGYSPKMMDISLHSNTRMDFEMNPNAPLQEVLVTRLNNPRKNGADKIPGELNESYNYFLGENDPVRSVYLLPGVLNVPENFSSMLVRGGGPDENLFLLDGTQVYNPSHMLGALSIVNQTALKSMQFFKSDFPARFSGSLSSVIDVYTKDGDMQQWHGEANAGILSGSFTLEGPVIKNKTAFMGSFRHTWPSPLYSPDQNTLKPDFYDINLKLTHLLNKNNKLMVNFYKGQDKLNQTSANMDNMHQWGNILGSVNWNHLIGAKSFINTSVNYSQYHNLGGYSYTLLDDQEEAVQSRSLGVQSSIEQWNARIQAEIFLSSKSRLNAGLKFNHTVIKPLETKITLKLEDNQGGFTSFQPLPYDEMSGYAEWEYKPVSRFIIRPGIHVSYYQFRDYNNFSVQPRIFTSFVINSKNQVYASYNRMTQYLHLVTNPYVGLNADLWLPSTAKLQPEQSESINLGYAFNNRKGFTFSIAGYYKSLQHITNYANGSSYFINDQNWEQNIESGRGWCYGMESMLQWTAKKFSFHMAYTLSWSWRQFGDINNGEKFPYTYDRRNILNIALLYHISKHWDISGLWSFSTGDAVSLPENIYPDYDAAQQISNPDDLLKNYRFTYQFTGVNQYRTANYQRLDAALSFHSDNRKKLQYLIAAGVYNISGSPDQYAYDLLGSVSSKSLVIRTSYIYYNIVPYISLTLKF
jgi:hypothetical protein